MEEAIQIPKTQTKEEPGMDRENTGKVREGR